MHEQAVGVVEPVPLLIRIFQGRVVLQVDPRQAPLLVGEDFDLIGFVIAARLEEQTVEVQVAHGPGWHVGHVGAEREGGADEDSPDFSLR